MEEASLYYFNKHVQDVDLGEAAILAGLPQNSSRINPRRHPERAKKRQIYVLDRMLANHAISREEHDREVEKPIVLPPPPAPPPGAWYVDEVRRQLVAQFGDAAVDTAGLTVEVAMDPRLQDAAEVALRENLRAIDKRQGFRGPELKIDPAAPRRLSRGPRAPSRLGGADARSGLGPRSGKHPLRRRPAQRGSEGAAPPGGGGGHRHRRGCGRRDAPGQPRAGRGRARGESAGARSQRDLCRHRHQRRPDGRRGGAGAGHRRERAVLDPDLGATLQARARDASAPKSPSDVLAVGDVVAVRVAHLATQRTATGTRVQRLELALEQTPRVQGAFVAID